MRKTMASALVLTALSVSAPVDAEEITVSWRFTGTLTSVWFVPDPDSPPPPIPPPLAIGDAFTGQFSYSWDTAEPSYQYIPWSYRFDFGDGIGIRSSDITERPGTTIGRWGFWEMDPLYRGPGGQPIWGNAGIMFFGSDLPATLQTLTQPLPESGSYWGEFNLEAEPGETCCEMAHLEVTADLDDFTRVPEPASGLLLLLGIGLASLKGARGRRGQRQ